MTYDYARLDTDWNQGRNQARALADSTRFFHRVVALSEDPVEHLDYFELAIEPHFDGFDGDPALVLEALRVADPIFRDAEEQAGLGSERQIQLRSRRLVMLARAYHRLGDAPEKALKFAYTAYFELEKAAGGKEDLLQCLRSREPSPVAEAMMAVIGVFAAASRRARLDPRAHRGLMVLFRALARAYVLSSKPVLYPRTLAFAAQCLYLFIGEGNPEDAKLIEALYRLDIASRPDNARAQATVPLRDGAYARHHGDLLEAARCDRAALIELERFGLPRHKRVVEHLRLIAA